MEDSPQAKPRRPPNGPISAFLQVETLTDRALKWLPEWVRDVVQDRRRQLLHVERQMQRRLLNEFRAQARELAPVLHMRGRMVGEIVLDSITGSSKTQMTYGDVVARSLRETVADKLPVRELIAVVDPLITPFVDPFVEGIKAPINEKASEIEARVVRSFAMAGGACLVAGFLLGRYLPRGGGRGSGGGNSDNGGSSGRGGGRW